MLQPKRTKFRKAFKGRIHGNAKGGTELNFGAYGLKAMAPERITARQIEAARRAIQRHIEDEISEFMIRQKENVPERIDFMMNGDEIVLVASPKDVDLIAN